MKFKSQSKYVMTAFYAFSVIAGSMVFYLFIVNFNNILSFSKTISSIFAPFTLGLVMAYLFNFFLVMYESSLLSKFKLKKGRKRFFGMVLTYLTVILLFSLFLQFILPQLISSLTGIIGEIPNFVKDFTIYVTKVSETINLSEPIQEALLKKSDEFLKFLVEFSTSLIPMLANYSLVIMSKVWNIVLGLIISIYLLSDKERFIALTKKVNYALLPKHRADRGVELLALANDIFGKFLSGKILDSAIVGVLTFVLLLIFKIPYALLIAFIVSITNIIPFFGPFIGAIPSFFIILFVSVNQAFVFLILIIIIQQIDGNLIGPKILGDSLNINAFWILFSLLLFGRIFGFIGMVVGVPLFVFIYALAKEVLERRLSEKNLPTETDAYRK